MFLRNIEALHLAEYIDYRDDSSRFVVTNWSGEIDFIFIDGNHRNEFVLEDIANWKKFVRSGGHIAFYEANNGGKVE